MHSPDPDTGLRRVEAARYALLRRLTVAMGHRMVMHLQPIGLISQVIERRLRDPAPDMTRLGQDIGRVNAYARTAVGTNLDVVSWLAPEAGQQSTLHEGVAECLSLLRGHFSFRGFQLRHEAGSASRKVSRAAIRTLLPAVLFGLTDDVEAPAEVLVRELETDTPALELRLGPRQGDAVEATLPPYRPLACEEVDAIAASEGARVERARDAVRLHLPPA